MPDPTNASPRRPLVIMLAGLGWLVAATGVVLAFAMPGPMPSSPLAVAHLLSTIFLAVAAPLAIVLIGLELVRRKDSDESSRLYDLEARTVAASAAAAAVRDGLLDVDATLAAIVSRLEGLRDVASGGAGLVDAATRLERAAMELTTAGEVAATKARELGLLMPDAVRQAESVATTLSTTGEESARQLGEVETMLAAVWTRNVDAREQVAAASATMAGLLGGIESASTAAADAIATRTATLHAGVDSALDRTTAALDATRDAVHVQTNALLASVDQARVALDAIGAEAAEAIAERIERVVAATDALGGRLDDHDARSATTVAAIERSFAVLDKRLAHAATMGTATLDHFHARMTAIGVAADAIDPPLAATNAALREAEASVGRLAEGAGATLATFAERLPPQRDAVAKLSADIAALSERTAALAAPVAAAADVVANAGAGFERQRASVETATATLAGELAAAQATLVAIEGSAQGSALKATTALIEALSRVREVANAAAGTMRTSLNDVIAETEAALQHAGTTHAVAAFGDPIRAEIAGLEGASAMAGAAAQATADRIAQRLLGLTAVVATIEARIDAVEGHAPPGDDLAKRGEHRRTWRWR